MASLILACIGCCCPHDRRGSQSFLTAHTTPKHKRHQHNPPTAIPNPAGISNTSRITPVPRTVTPKTSEDYTFEVLKVENERRVRQLAEAGVMDVPHGVLSREVGTPEVAPKYGDVVEPGGEVWELDRGYVPVQGRARGGEEGGNRETGEGEWHNECVMGGAQGPSPGRIQPPERLHVASAHDGALR